MRLGPFVDEIHRVRGVSRDELREKFLEAAKTVVQKHFGDRSRIEIAWNEEGGVIELRQVLTVVSVVREPFRELPMQLVQKLVPDPMQEGEELEVSVFYADADQEAAKQMDQMFGGLLKLSSFQSRLWEPLVEAFLEIIHTHLPPATFPEGTLGWLMQNDGGWTKGVRGGAGDVSVSIAGAVWKERPSSPTAAMVLYGFTLRVVRGGRGVTFPLQRSVDRGAAALWAAHEAPPARTSALERALGTIAEQMIADRSLEDPQAEKRLKLLFAALRG